MIKDYPDALFEEMKLLAKFPEKSQLIGIKLLQRITQQVIAIINVFVVNFRITNLTTNTLIMAITC